MSRSLRFGKTNEIYKEIAALKEQIVLLDHEENQLIRKLSESKVEIPNKKDKDLFRKITAHKLYGLTVLKETENEQTLRLDLNYKGHYQETFMFELNKVDDKWHIEGHNFHHFMSLKMMLQEQFSNNPKAIINDCDNYLRAYLYRKNQVIEAMQHFPKLIFDWTLTYNYVAIRFCGFEKMKGVKAILRYGPYDEAPVDIDFKVEDAQFSINKKKEIEKLKKLFDSRFILDALRILSSE